MGDETVSRKPSRLPSYAEGVPSGLICMWHGLIANIPAGWLLCDGNNGTPDLRAKFVRGSPAATEAGGTGGEDTHTLTVAELPAHTHAFTADKTSGSNARVSHVGQTIDPQTVTTSSVGSSSAHENRPAYYQVLFIMKS